MFANKDRFRSSRCRGNVGGQKQKEELGLSYGESLTLADEDSNLNAQVILLFEGDDEFNTWSTGVGREQAEEGQPLVYVMIKKLCPARSRIEGLALVSG